MARSLRITYPGAFYHITSRGNERKDVFKSQADRKKFLFYLETATERYGAVIHGYCLMSNHYHLLLETPGGNLSQIMRHINGAYTTYFNAKRRRSGHLFQGRYKAILIEVDRHVKELSRYIHLNPVRAGMVERPEEHVWSSYQAFIGQSTAPKCLHREFILGYFADKEKIAQQRYRAFTEDMLEKTYESPLDGVMGSILGDEEFVGEVTARYLKEQEVGRDIPELRQLIARPSPEQIISIINTEITNSAKNARNASIYFCHRYSGLKLQEIGVYFNIKESAISEASRRFSEKMERDSLLRVTVEKVRSKLEVWNM